MDGRTGTGTAETLLARSLRERGLSGGDVAALRAALDASAADGVDSDGDEVIDVDELRDGSDPNVAGGDGSSAPVPEYGCGAHIAGAGAPRAWGWTSFGVGFVLAWSLVGRSRRGRAR